MKVFLIVEDSIVEDTCKYKIGILICTKQNKYNIFHQ